MIKKSLALFLCILLLLSSMTMAAFGADEVSGKLIHMEGDVQVIRSGGEKPFNAFLNMRLAEGDKIITGPAGTAKIQLDDDVVIILAEDTQIYLSELRGSAGAAQSSISLQAGGVGASINKALEDNARFEIKTPTAVMGVRGTEFFTQYFNGTLDARVINGVVEVNVNITGQGDITGAEFAGSATYSFLLTALQQVSFNEGEAAAYIADSIEELNLDGLPAPFLNRISEISEENPAAIPQDIVNLLGQAIENAIKALQDKSANQSPAPDAFSSLLAPPLASNIRAAVPAITPPPPASFSSGSSGSGPTMIPVSEISLNLTTMNLPIGITEQITATVSPANATNKTVTWTSTNTAVATVDAAGNVTAVSEGTATIYAAADGRAAECMITVYDPNAYYTLTLDDPHEMLSADPATGDPLIFLANTPVTITLTPLQGAETAAFLVNGVDKMLELQDNTYEFNIVENTTISYELAPMFDFSYWNDTISSTEINPEAIERSIPIAGQPSQLVLEISPNNNFPDILFDAESSDPAVASVSIDDDRFIIIVVQPPADSADKVITITITGTLSAAYYVPFTRAVTLTVKPFIG